MAVSLILGNTLLIGMALGNAVYLNAVLNRVLAKDLSNFMSETKVYPLQMEMSVRMDSIRTAPVIAPKIRQMEALIDELPKRIHLDTQERITDYYINCSSAVSAASGRGKEVKRLQLGFLSDLEKHCTVVAGRMYQNPQKDGVIEVIVSRQTMMEQNLTLGEELVLNDLKDKDGNPFAIKVTGVFENSEEDDIYWVKSPDEFTQRFFMEEQLFKTLFVDYENPRYIWNSSWNLLFSNKQMKADKTGHVLQTLRDFNNDIGTMNLNSKEYFGNILNEFQEKQEKLESIVFLLEIPIFILLIIFIYMVNQQMMLLERGDIAILKSRGAGNGQVIGIYFLQGSFFAGMGFLFGIPLGMFFCYMLGNANAFLGFVSRTALKLEFTKEAMMYPMLCAVFSLVITLFSALYHTKESIVSYKRKMNTKNKKFILWGFIAGAVFLGIAVYGLYSYNLRGKISVQSPETGAMLDPLMFCSSVFFIIGSAFLALSLFPFLMKGIFKCGKSRWGPSAYAAFQKVITGSENQGFIILFLILTISLGIFDAAIARTINKNEEDRIVYSIGADLVVQEVWKSNEDSLSAYKLTMEAMGEKVPADNLDVIYVEPDFNRYTALDGVDKATKVMINDNVKVSVPNGTVSTRVMGINTKEFGETAYFKTSLLKEHWFQYLNGMSQDENGVLVSSNFREIYDYQEGDSITYFDEDNHSIRGKICGFVDFWPSYQPVAKLKGSDGIIKEVNQFLIVSNLSKVQAAWGIKPYQVWIRTKGSSVFLYDFAEKNQIKYEIFKDLSAEIIHKNNNPMFQGTNGILTLGFIIILLICAAGFLIYWTLSILSRTLQIGVFRAMGMSIAEVLGMLVWEQLFLSIIPILFGILIGNIVSGLFVPLIQLAYTSSEQIIPLEIVNQPGDRIKILIMVGLMVIFCMAVIGKLILNLKMTKALKLGED